MNKNIKPTIFDKAPKPYTYPDLKCGICGKQMRHAKDKPFGLDSDCGGDCWECVKDSEGTS